MLTVAGTGPGANAVRAAGASSDLIGYSAEQRDAAKAELDTRSADAPAGLAGWGVAPAPTAWW